MKKVYQYLIVPVSVLALASCGGGKKTGPPPIPPTPVSIADVKKGDAVYYDQYQGTVTSLNTVELRSQVPGFLTGIYFKEGDVVIKGQILYEIDKRKYQAAYDQAKANLASANANLVKAQKDEDRYNMLLKADAVARQTVDNAHAAYESAQGNVQVAKAGVESAATDLSFSIIRAPFTGRIGISQVRLGAVVGAGTTLLNTISTEDPIAVDVVINEQDIDRFYKLQKSSTDSTFKLQLSDGTALNRPGKVLAIDRGVNNQTGTIKVRVQFPNHDDQLKDGMSGVLKVLNNQSGERLIIPYKAVTEQMGEFFVFTYKDTLIHNDTVSKQHRDTIASQHKIVLGPRLVDQVVVMSGLNAGDKVITDGIQRLKDNGKVTLNSAAPPTAANGAAAGKKQ